MIIAPMGTFCPDMFGLVGAEKQLYRTGHRSICQSDDIHDDDYIVQTRVRHEEVRSSGYTRTKVAVSGNCKQCTGRRLTSS